MRILFVFFSLLLGLTCIQASQANLLYGVDVTFVNNAETNSRLELVDLESVLYMIDPETGDATPIGPTGFVECSGLDFHPVTNELFAVCRTFIEVVPKTSEDTTERSEDDEPIDLLVKLDINTGQGQEIGPLEIETENPSITRVTDISFDDTGTLHAYVFNVVEPNNNQGLGNTVTRPLVGPDADRLGIIDTSTGKYTEIGPTGFANLFSGIAFSLQNELYHAGGQDINFSNKLNLQTGEHSPMAPLNYPPELVNRLNRVASMELKTSVNRLFAVIQSEEDENGEPVNPEQLTTRQLEEFYLTTINPNNGTVSIIGPTVFNLAAIASLPRDRTQIPTLSEWSLIALSGVLMLMGALYLRKKAQV